MHPPTSIIAIALSLGLIEGVAYWWMRPAPAGQGEPVLVYRPQEVKVEKLKTESSGTRWTGAIRDVPGTVTAGGRDQKLNEEAVTQSSSSSQNPKSKIQNPDPPSSNQQSTINNRHSEISPSSTLTPLPEIYAKSAPMLRCSGGQVLHARLDDSSGIHLAFFEWDGTDTGSVLEAFRHMPEACMGSIGLKLVEKAPPRSYVVGGQGSEVRVQGAGGRGQVETTAQSSSSNQKSKINNHQSSISSPNQNSKSNIQNSKFATQSLVFDHTIFREGGGVTGLGPPIHAFRAVWVSGVPMADARQGLAGDDFDRLRTIRLKSAIERFRPAHARVIQGAVRGIADPDLAWEAFEKAMLKDLSFQ